LVGKPERKSIVLDIAIGGGIANFRTCERTLWVGVNWFNLA
jgi:phosphoribosylformimino-5-aminoimidazole carboxamide ribonucleotide (ProFAR) isomerase